MRARGVRLVRPLAAMPLPASRLLSSRMASGGRSGEAAGGKGRGKGEGAGDPPARPARPSDDAGGGTVGQYVGAAHDRWEHKDVIIDSTQDNRWTYVELMKHSTAWGSGLAQARTRRHHSLPNPDRVAVMLPDNCENLVTQLGTAMCGRITAMADPAIVTSVGDVGRFMQSVSPRMVIFPPEFNKVNAFETFYQLIDELEIWPWEVPLNVKQFPELKVLLNTGITRQRPFNSWRNVLYYQPAPNPMPKPEAISPDEIATVAYSDGQAVTFTHRSLVTAAHSFGAYLGLKTSDRVCIATPFHKTYSTAGILACIGHGAIAVLTGGTTFDAEKAILALERDSCSHLLCLPSQLREILEHPLIAKHPAHTLKHVVLVRELSDGQSEKGIVELAERATTALQVQDVHVVQASPHIAGFIFAQSARSAPESLGKLLPNLEARILDKGKSVKSGASGQLHVRGTTVMRGLWNDQAATKPLLDNDGWLNTGLQAKASSTGEYARV